MKIVDRIVTALRKSFQNSLILRLRVLKKTMRTKGRSISAAKFDAELNRAKTKPTACRMHNSAKNTFLILSFFFYVLHVVLNHLK